MRQRSPQRPPPPSAHYFDFGALLAHATAFDALRLMIEALRPPFLRDGFPLRFITYRIFKLEDGRFSMMFIISHLGGSADASCYALLMPGLDCAGWRLSRAARFYEIYTFWRYYCYCHLFALPAVYDIFISLPFFF